MGREIKLSGGEISVLKIIGLSGAPIAGKKLVEHNEEMETAEFVDELSGLIEQGYVLSNKVNIRILEDVEHAFFRVNPSFAQSLRSAINPSRRREEEGKRRRRRS